MSSKTSAVKPNECENVAKESGKKSKILNYGLNQRRKIYVLRHCQKYIKAEALHGRLQNSCSGLRTYQSKCTKFIFF